MTAMSKKDEHLQDLKPLFETFLETGDPVELAQYLLDHSALPGPRANLELAEAFADTAGAAAVVGGDQLWTLCQEMAGLPAEMAPVNHPREFLPFCAAAGLGAIGAAVPSRFDPALETLRNLARDPRWRLREGVCFGAQRLLAARGIDTIAALRQWVGGGNWLELRAAAATVAEPALLKDKKMAVHALQLHKEIMAQVLQAQDRSSEPFKTLRQALGYTISVVAVALPREGLDWLGKLQQAPDPDVQWIVRENFKKERLKNLIA